MIYIHTHIIHLSITPVEIYKDQPYEKSKVYLFIPYYSKHVSHHHSHFGRDSKTDRGGKALYRNKGEAQVLCLEAVGRREAAGGLPEGVHPMLGILLSLVGPKLEAGIRIIIIKSWPFGADCYRSYCLASWIVTRNSNAASCKSD